MNDFKQQKRDDGEASISSNNSGTTAGTNLQSVHSHILILLSNPHLYLSKVQIMPTTINTGTHTESPYQENLSILELSNHSLPFRIKFTKLASPCRVASNSIHPQPHDEAKSRRHCMPTKLTTTCLSPKALQK